MTWLSRIYQGSALYSRNACAKFLFCTALLVAHFIAVPGYAQVPATITYVGSAKSALSSSTTSSVPIVVPTGVLAGDVMIALQTYNPNASASGPSSGWTFLAGNNTSASGASVWYRVATSADVAGSTTYTWTVTAGSMAGGYILAFRGVNTSNPILAYASQANASSTSRIAPSVTPGTAYSMLIAAYAVANGTADTLTSPTGMTLATNGSTTQGTAGVLVAGFYELLTPATATGTLVSQSGSSLSALSIGFSIALKPATIAPLAQWHLDETAWTGSTGEVVDSSGNGYNGVAVNGATTGGVSPAITGSPGTCYYGNFNGSTQYVQLPSSLPHFAGSLTVTAWIRPTGTQVGRIIADDENANGWGLSFNDDGGNTLHFYSNNPSFFVDSTLALTLNQWYFVAAIQTTIQGYQYLFLFIFDASGNLLGNTGNATASAFGASTGANYSIGGDITGSATGGTHRFAGTIDEVTLYASGLSYNQVQPLSAVTHACSGIVPNHYSVSAASPVVNCTPASVSVIAHNSAHTPIATADTMALSTSTGHGDWTLTTGNGTFTAGSSNSGAASYTYAQSDNGSAVFALRDTYAETVTIGVSDGGVTAQSGTARANEDSPLTFVASGFRITNGGNVAATIGTQVAGVASSQSLALQAVRTDTNTGACTNVFPSGTSVNVSLAFQCNNPATCVSGQTLSVSNNGASTSIAANPATGISSYTSVPLKFTTANAEAPISLNYSDVGQITLAAKYTLPLGSGALSGTSLTGAAQFVVEPYSFNLSSIKTTASGTANPAASSATGPVFIAAGQSFSATVTAVNAVGNATPNFGQELSPATVSLAPGLVLPTTGNLPAVSGSFGTFSAGVASGTRFSWPEVGIMSLTPSTSNYLSTGNTITGASSGNVGRFIPNSFSYALNTPSFLAACPATNAGFTYVGQPFNYSVAPVITVTALALGGTTTQNYAGSFFKLTNASLTGRSYTPTPSSPGLTLTGLPATTADPVIASSGGGIATLTFSSGTGISFTRGSAIAPFNANIALSINVIDTDGVVAANPVTFGASTGIAFTTAAGSQQYYGRLALNDAVGSELLDLPMTLTTQYYVGTAAGFATNTQDTCTTHPAIALSNYQLNLTSTCVRDSGSPGLSGVGCTTAASPSSAYRTTPASGNFNLNLAAPGSGYAGAVTVTATAPTWLQYPWNASSCGASNLNPCGLATFGVFPGPASRIYQREVY